MTSISKLYSSIVGTGSYYQKSPRHASYVFNQDARSLYRNQPRVPFEFYVGINLNNVGTASSFISTFINSTDLTQIAPLIKSVEMPSMKLDTTPLNQYNRKRLSQSTIKFEPIKMVFHDVVDGKTLKFWNMYYSYYFADGLEPGMNVAKSPQQNASPSSGEMLANIQNNSQSVIQGVQTGVVSAVTSSQALDTSAATNDNGSKELINNIISNTLDNHKFGFNLPAVQNIRNLIQSIDIYQVHAGRYNKVTLVNPRISAFTHDLLSYSVTDKTLEITFSIEYEYAYYTLTNAEMDADQLDIFSHGEFLDLPALSFTSVGPDFIQTNNTVLTSSNPLLPSMGQNVQSSINTTVGQYTTNIPTQSSSSVLNGLTNISPSQYIPPISPPITPPQDFSSTSTSTSITYIDSTTGESYTNVTSSSTTSYGGYVP